MKEFRGHMCCPPEMCIVMFNFFLKKSEFLFFIHANNRTLWLDECLEVPSSFIVLSTIYSSLMNAYHAFIYTFSFFFLNLNLCMSDRKCKKSKLSGPLRIQDWILDDRSNIIIMWLEWTRNFTILSNFMSLKPVVNLCIYMPDAVMLQQILIFKTVEVLLLHFFYLLFLCEIVYVHFILQSIVVAKIYR